MNIVTNQLPLEDITHIPEKYHRLFMFDPSEVYEKIYNHVPSYDKHTFSHYKRRNHVEMSVIFPTVKTGICACGCGGVLSGRRRRWATDECQRFALMVHQIISGDTDIIRRLFRVVFGEERCVTCGKSDNEIPRKEYHPEREQDLVKRTKLWNKEIREMANKIHVEHIVPVHKGGGGCWLGNYQLMCESCHKEKTKLDRVNI